MAKMLLSNLYTVQSSVCETHTFGIWRQRQHTRKQPCSHNWKGMGRQASSESRIGGASSLHMQVILEECQEGLALWTEVPNFVRKLWGIFALLVWFQIHKTFPQMHIFFRLQNDFYCRIAWYFTYVFRMKKVRLHHFWITFCYFRP